MDFDFKVRWKGTIAEDDSWIPYKEARPAGNQQKNSRCLPLTGASRLCLLVGRPCLGASKRSGSGKNSVILRSLSTNESTHMHTLRCILFAVHLRRGKAMKALETPRTCPSLLHTHTRSQAPPARPGQHRQVPGAAPRAENCITYLKAYDLCGKETEAL